MKNRPVKSNIEIDDLNSTGLEVGDEVEALLWLFDSSKNHLSSLWKSISNMGDELLNEKKSIISQRFAGIIAESCWYVQLSPYIPLRP